MWNISTGHQYFQLCCFWEDGRIACSYALLKVREATQFVWLIDSEWKKYASNSNEKQSKSITVFANLLFTFSLHWWRCHKIHAFWKVEPTHRRQLSWNVNQMCNVLCPRYFHWIKPVRFLGHLLIQLKTSLVAQMINHLPTVWETRVQSLGREDLLEKEMAAHFSIFAWQIPWTEEPGRL